MGVDFRCKMKESFGAEIASYYKAIPSYTCIADSKPPSDCLLSIHLKDTAMLQYYYALISAITYYSIRQWIHKRRLKRWLSTVNPQDRPRGLA